MKDNWLSAQALVIAQEMCDLPTWKKVPMLRNAPYTKALGVMTLLDAVCDYLQALDYIEAMEAVCAPDTERIDAFTSYIKALDALRKCAEAQP